jgi:hypothetical protein
MPATSPGRTGTPIRAGTPATAGNPKTQEIHQIKEIPLILTAFCIQLIQYADPDPDPSIQTVADAALQQLKRYLAASLLT